MRELILVRKLEEENAKRKQTGDTIKDTSVSGSLSSERHSNEPTKEDLYSHKDITNSSSPTTDANNQNPPSSNESQEIPAPEIENFVNNKEHLSDTLSQLEENVYTENTNLDENQIVNSMENTHTALDSSINNFPEISEEERRQQEESALELKTRRESLKEFFRQQQPYVRDTTDTIPISTGTVSLDADKAIGSQETTGKLPQLKEENTINGASDEAESVAKLPTAEDEPKTTSMENKNLSVPPLVELSPDEKRQKAAASRAMQKKNLREMMKQKRRQVNAEQKEESDGNVIIITPDTKSNTETDPQATGDVQANAGVTDPDSDGSVDLDALIAQGSDLDSSNINLEIDGVNDDDDDFWKVDSSELEKRLTPSTSPLRQLSPDPRNLPSMAEVIEEEEDLSDTILAVDDQEVDDLWGSSANTHNYELESKEEDEFDRSLDTQITPSNGSHTSVRSNSSSKSGASSIRRPSTTMGIRAPSRISSHGAISPSRIGSPNYSGIATPSRSRSMSIVSNSSAEESTTSSAGGAHSPIRIASPTRGLRTHQGITSGIPTGARPRSRSKVSTSSTDEGLTRSSTQIRTTKTSNIISPNKKIKNGVPEATNSKIASSKVPSTRITSPTRGLRSPQAITSGIPTGTRPRTQSRIGTSSTSEGLTRSASVAGTPTRSLNRSSTQIGTTKTSSTVSPAKKTKSEHINWFSWSFWISTIALLILQFVNFILSVAWQRSTAVECTHELNYLIVGNSSSTLVPLNQSSVDPQVLYDACKQASSLYICWTLIELVIVQFMLFVYFGLVVNAYKRDLRKEGKVISDEHDADGRDVRSNNKENIEREKVGLEAPAEGE
ncbi:5936_t:CDS:2 [Paraglomus occultum]|uniref:5936_t:CDS:1 n=1 Tax=Paraglomus occultum TaxID=144539 RepID=A0A9N9B7K5_9GLOM|nr:5936_t:CDS:2 [Paraglomus occultum]